MVVVVVIVVVVLACFFGEFFCYLFDSNSRDIQGLSITDGTSELFTFASLLKVESYIQVENLELRDIHQSCFIVQFTNVETDRTSCLNILG